MIVLRPIGSSDIEAVTALGVEAANTAEGIPAVMSAEKVRAMVSFFANDGDGHFNLVAFDEGVPVAGIAAYVQEMPFFERSEAQVVMCFSKSHGIGCKLIRALIQWADSNMAVRRIVWVMNEGNEKLASQMARVFGFKHRLDVCVRYR